MNKYTETTRLRLDALRDTDSAAYSQLMMMPFTPDEENMSAQLDMYEEENGVILVEPDEDDEPEPYDDEDQEPEPTEDDLVTSDDRRFYQYRKLVLTVDEDEDRDDALVAFMNRQQFWPNCFLISDHGNAHLIDLAEAYKRATEGK